MTRALPGVGLVLVALWSGPACAIEEVYRVGRGETLESISLYFYGRSDLADSLRLHNALEGPPEVGVALRVPLADRHRIASGDSWSSLAERYWGDAARFRVLAELSGHEDSTLVPGEIVRVPALIEHAVRAGESFAVISRKTYGGPGRASALARLNRDADPDRLAVGQVVLVPVLMPAPERALDGVPDLLPAVSAVAPHAPSASTPEPGAEPAVEPALAAAPKLAAAPALERPAPPEPPRLVTEVETIVTEVETDRVAGSLGPALDAAITLYQRGRFDEARRSLESLRPQALAHAPDSERERLLRHLVYVYVAFDQTELACQSADARKTVDPTALWDPVATSPKILNTLESCPAAPLSD